MESRKQLHEEKFWNYCLEMWKLCKLWKDGMEDKEIVNYIYDEITPSLKSKLLPYFDSSFSEFMTKGKNFEELMDKELNTITKPFKKININSSKPPNQNFNSPSSNNRNNQTPKCRNN